MSDTQMKSLYFSAPETMEVLDVPVPEPGFGQVQVKVAFASLCATDIHQVTQGVLGAKPPMPLGHETAGVVSALGQGTEHSGLVVGDKVTAFPVSICGQCVQCQKGQSQYCVHAAPFGGFSEYYVTNVNNVFRLPDDADLRHYTIVEPTVCAVRAMDVAPIRPGQTVAISGTGGIGAILLNVILLSGGANVTVIEPVEAKREAALAMGAQHVIDPFNEDVVEAGVALTDGQGFDVFFEASGSPKAAQPALDLTGKCGRTVYFAVYPPTFEMPLNLYDLYSREGAILTVFTSPQLFPRAIELLPRLDVERLLGPTVPLSDALTAVDMFHTGQYAKILLDCSK